MECECYGFGLAEVRVVLPDCGGYGRGSTDLEPFGKARVGVQEFVANGGRDDDALEKLRQQLIEPCLQQRGDRRGVADDEHWSAAGAEFLDGDEILREVLDAVVHRDFAAARLVKKLRLVEVEES